MYLHRPGEAASRSRFWLALSLSTVTAAAVAAPLALKAVSYDAQRDPAAPGGTSVPVTAPESPTSLELPGIGADDASGGRGNIVPEPADTGSTDEVTETSPPTTRPAPTTTTEPPPVETTVPTTEATTTSTSDPGPTTETTPTTEVDDSSTTSSSSSTSTSTTSTTAVDPGATTPTAPGLDDTPEEP